MYMSTHMSTPYLDLLMCMHPNIHGIINLHLLVIPVYKRHMYALIFVTAAKDLDVLFPSWKNTNIGISADGE